ncbi:MAG: hypothetical protein QOF32_508 [Gammaproteobacteria bacterium]|jgi:hypothetical protein|nr:hypothetical protein [Gammaproteobacteria bacterium]
MGRVNKEGGADEVQPQAAWRLFTHRRRTVMKTAWLGHGEDCECVGCTQEKEYMRTHYPNGLPATPVSSPSRPLIARVRAARTLLINAWKYSVEACAIARRALAGKSEE